MRKSIVVGLVVLAVCSCLSLLNAEEKGKNLAPNPSFEQGEGNKVISWAFWAWAPKGVKATSKCIRDDTVAHTGTHSLKVQGMEAKQTGVWDNQHGGELIPVEEGKVYTVSVWIKTQTIPNEGRVKRLAISFYDEQSQGLKEGRKEYNPDLTGENDWTRAYFLVRTPEKAKFARIDLFFDGIGSAWFDDVEVIEAQGYSRIKREAINLNLPYLLSGKVKTAPLIDGKLNDACWKTAIELAPFVLISGNGFPREQTKGYLLYDEKNLYLGVECTEALLDPVLQRTHEIKSKVEKRDGEVWGDDCVEIFIQPEPEKSAYYHLVVNSLGTLYDAHCDNGKYEKGWNSKTKIAVSADDKSWKVELAIPLADFNKSIEKGDKWSFNLCRHENPNKEYSAWSPTVSTFHNPEAFGVVCFGEETPGTRGLVLPDFPEGGQKIEMRILNDTAEEKHLFLSALTKYDQGDWVCHAQEVLLPEKKESQARVEYSLSKENKCFFLNASRDGLTITQSFSTALLKVLPDTTYLISAMVKTENLESGKKPSAFYINCYDASGKCLAAYDVALTVPSGTYGWKRIEGKWRSPLGAAKIFLLMVKWGNTEVTGKLWMDDMWLRVEGTDYNIIPNGGLIADKDGAVKGWPSRISIVSSYKRGNSVTTVFQLTDTEGNTYYSSTPISGELRKKITAISSSFLLKSSMVTSSDMHRLKELYVAQGSYLYLPVVLRSSMKEKLTDCQLFLEVPGFLQLINPQPRAALIKQEEIQREGLPYHRYLLSYPLEAISPAEAKKETTTINHLLLKCGLVPEGKNEWKIVHYAAVKDKVEEKNELGVVITPALQWKRPKDVLIQNCACPYFWRPLLKFNKREQEHIFKVWRQAGFTQVRDYLSPEVMMTKYGFSSRNRIPHVNEPGSLFPGGMEYLVSYPEARAIDFTGKKYNNCFCPTYFLSKENKHWDEVRKWLAKTAREISMIEWDYEVSVTKDSSICLCKRCLKAFREYAEISPTTTLTSQIILSKYKKQWVDFRCYQNAEIAHLFRDAIKKANPDCLFTVYSGYQGTTDERYGVDWKYMSKYTDIVMCGYGRPIEAIADTHKVINQRPFLGGENAWYGNYPYDNAMAKTCLFRRLSDCGFGILVYFDWNVDGRFYSAVSAAASLVADFESFFQYDIGKDGLYISRYNRNDKLIKISGEGTEKDATVLLWKKERLVFLFNEKKGARTFHVENLSWEPDMYCVDYETKKVYSSKLSLTIPPREVRVLHIAKRTKKEMIEAPILLAPDEQQKQGNVPILVWQGKGSQPGDQVYTLEISENPKFPDKQTIKVSNLASNTYIPREKLKTGATYLWRVKGKDVVTKKEGLFSKPSSFIVPVFAELATLPDSFSPNDDGNVDTFHLFALLNEDTDWNVVFSEPTGKKVRTLKGKGKSINIDWDGKDKDGKIVPEGVYNFLITPEKYPKLTERGKVEVNMRVGLENPSFSVCRRFILTIPEGNIKKDKDYKVTRSKTYSIRMKAIVPKSTCHWSNYAAGGINNKIPVVPGKKYCFSAYIKSSLSQGSGHLALTFFTNDGRWASAPGKIPWGEPSEEVTGNTDWVKREISLVAPENADSAVLSFRVKEALGTCWFDDVEFKAVK